ncbi:glycosyltransferase family 2 protein [Solirhodobacter olei]|uniref:glycosyltransferase family 2 protein n=1 Tax=Solirhodobacter olei TaxID=2493082 RepID=UPI001F4D9E38|nr:glycosyltransferase family 2 protein [Solirhodobacter olei]
MKTVAIVIPMHNEAGAVAPLVTGIRAACASLASFEIIAVDDGSTDDTAERLRALMADVPELRLLQHPKAGGQSAAVHSGVLAAEAGIICTLDGDGQNPPEELPKLWAPFLADTAGRIGLVAGQRVARQDTLSKRLASRLANRIRAFILKDGTRDTGCGLKGFRREAFLAFPYFDHMHRYLPALAKRDGWEVVLVDVSHRERAAGKSKYSNFQRALVGVADLAGVAWLIRRRKKARAVERAGGQGGGLD